MTDKLEEMDPCQSCGAPVQMILPSGRPMYECGSTASGRSAECRQRREDNPDKDDS